MHIDAINTLEIRFFEEPDAFFEDRLTTYQEKFKEEQGCTGFVINRSSLEPYLWILTGHWTETSQMTAHFCGEEMAELVSTLIELRANLSFARFAKVDAENMSDVC